MHRVFQKIVPRLNGNFEGAIDAIISVFTQLHRSGFNLEFETLFESVGEVVADLWQRKGKRSSCFKTADVLFSSNAEIKQWLKERILMFQIFSTYIKGLTVLS